MAALKPLLGTTLVLLTTAVLLIGPRLFPLTPYHVRRSYTVTEHYQSYDKRLQAYYKSLSAVLAVNAPDLLPALEPPKPPQHGYRILPRIVPDLSSSEQRPRAQAAWYSWPWTDQLIDSGMDEIARSEEELLRAAGLRPTARRGLYEKLARAHREMRDRQRNIDAHIQYNRLWQAAIAADRSAYDRGTVLHNQVLQRQAALDALRAMIDAGFKNTAGIDRSGATQRFAEMTAGWRERERLLARDIHRATAHVSTPAFVRVDRRGPHFWVFHVPFYTDIENRDFVESVKAEIEKIWDLRDGGDEFRVELDLVYIPAGQLYGERPSPQTGDHLDAYKHVGLFPLDGAVLTTGAITTHVYGRAIVLGPHDIAPRTLAHEFGHILGFKDLYFRGYKDLGRNGFQVMEVIADSDDIMGAPATGSVLRRHFEKILESFRTKGRSLSKT